MRTKGEHRQVDDLGRIVLPASIRKRLQIKEKDALQIQTFGKYILLKKSKRQ